MSILVDSSIWIDYFKSGKNSEKLDYFIDENILFVNDLILAELIPFLKIKRQNEIIQLLKSINRLELNINWAQLIDFQHKCLKNGINGIGIPDLIITQNAIQNNCTIYSLDKHFKMMKVVIDINLEN
ncbi:MAG: PIN domain-containing protein [Desulfobacula sp.]|jgi:predicted nucleic acid-binding protein|nr:PIN domain-containing protein [Desulfobacula sp.]